MTDPVESVVESAAREAAKRFDTGTRERPIPMNAARQSAFVSGAEWQREQDETEVMRVAAQRAERIRELEADLDMARQEYHELEEFHRLYINPYKQRAKQAEEALRKAQDKLDAIEQLWNISGHFEHDELYDKMMELLMGTDITCSYGPVLYEIREVLSNAPECDKYSDDDTISCGWKKDMIQVRRILDESGI